MFSNDPSSLIQCTVYSVQCTVYSVHCTVYSVHCTVYNVHCAVFSVHCTVYIPEPGDCRHTLWPPPWPWAGGWVSGPWCPCSGWCTSVQYMMFTFKVILYCVLYTVHCTACKVQYSVQYLCTEYSMCSKLYSVHCTVHSTCSAGCTPFACLAGAGAGPPPYMQYTVYPKLDTRISV